MSDADARIWWRDEDGFASLEIRVAGDADRVWRMLSEPGLIERWFGWEYDGLAGEVREIFVDNATLDPAAREIVVWGGDRLRVEPDGDGARLVATRGESSADPEPDELRLEPFNEDWTGFLEQLRHMAERHPDEPRTTARAGGAASGGPDAALARLGVSEVVALAAGEDFALEHPRLGRLSGSVRFRSRHRAGLALDQLGDGLVVLARSAPSDSEPDGGLSITATAYGSPSLEPGTLAAELERSLRA